MQNECALAIAAFDGIACRIQNRSSQTSIDALDPQVPKLGGFVEIGWRSQVETVRSGDGTAE